MSHVIREGCYQLIFTKSTSSLIQGVTLFLLHCEISQFTNFFMVCFASNLPNMDLISMNDIALNYLSITEYKKPRDSSIDICKM